MSETDETVDLRIVIRTATGVQDYLVTVSQQAAFEIKDAFSRSADTIAHVTSKGVPFALRGKDVVAILPAKSLPRLDNAGVE